MNEENLKQLIDAIKFDGKTKFNMHTFIGKFDENYYNDRVFKDGDLAHLYRASQVQSIEPGTDIFNCTSMGCIAGFATAISNNWKAPEWLSHNEDINFAAKFEFESNEFLGFSTEEGKNIYYNDGKCIWKWLMLNEPDTYPGLKLEDVDGDECYSMEEAMELASGMKELISYFAHTHEGNTLYSQKKICQLQEESNEAVQLKDELYELMEENQALRIEYEKAIQ